MLGVLRSVLCAALGHRSVVTRGCVTLCLRVWELLQCVAMGTESRSAHSLVMGGLFLYLMVCRQKSWGWYAVLGGVFVRCGDV